MTTTTRPDFDEKTEGLEVASLFADGIRGKSILITGVNIKGIGYTTAEAIASQSPALVIIAGRDESRLETCAQALKSSYNDVQFRTLRLDLARQQAVRESAAEVLSWTDVPKIDILVNNAGVMLLPKRTLNDAGIEMHLATNHIGHFLFTCLIMPKLIQAANGNDRGSTRIVNITSASPKRAAMRWSDINFDKINSSLPESEQPSYETHRAWGIKNPEEMSYIPLEGYNQSKVANVLFSVGINGRLYEKHGILSFAVHPGVIETELGRNADDATQAGIQELFATGVIKYKSQRAGAAPAMIAALDPKLGKPISKDGKDNYGVYRSECQVSEDAHPLAVSNVEADKLWALSESLVKEKFAW